MEFVVGYEMYPFFLLGIQAYEAKIELLHAGNVPLGGIQGLLSSQEGY